MDIPLRFVFRDRGIDKQPVFEHQSANPQSEEDNEVVLLSEEYRILAVC